MLLGLLPIYRVAVGEVVAASYDPLLVGIVNLLLLFSIGGIPLVTLGFFVGVAVRYGRDLTLRAQWVAVRVGISAVLWAGLYVAAGERHRADLEDVAAVTLYVDEASADHHRAVGGAGRDGHGDGGDVGERRRRRDRHRLARRRDGHGHAVWAWRRPVEPR